MINGMKKYGMMIIAAVLLVALAFAGAASAVTVTLEAGDNGSISGATSPVEDIVSFSIDSNSGVLGLTSSEKVTTSVTPIPNSGYAFVQWLENGIQAGPGGNLIKDTTFKAVFGPVVAEINGVGYATVDAAFKAATDGQTIKLLKDSKMTDTITVSKTLTLDLNGKVLTASDKNSGDSLLLLSDGSASFTGKTFTIIDSAPSAVHYFKYNAEGPWEAVESSAVDKYVTLSDFNLTNAEDASAKSENYYVAVTGGVLYGGGSATISRIGVSLGTGGKLYMTGGNIVGCGMKGVNVNTGAEFIMENSAIVGCYHSDAGAGVRVNGGTFTMKSGASIVGCLVKGDLYCYGGGVSVDCTYPSFSSKFTMESGSSIVGCKVCGGGTKYHRGGGIYISDGSSRNPGTYMIKGTIKDCKVVGTSTSKNQGGGVFIAKGSVEMSGTSKITGCSAAPTSEGAGVYVSIDGGFKIGGSALVDETNDVHLCCDVNNEKYGLITVGSALTSKDCGVHLITLDSLTNWTAKTVVKGGAAYVDSFKLSTAEAYSSYVLLPGGDQDKDLVLSKGYAITYEYLPVGADNPNPKRYVDGASVTFKPASKSGYHFFAWYSDEDLKTETTGIEQGSSGDMTVYAKMPANETAVTFTYEDKSSVSDKFTYNASVEIPDEKEKGGYVFHWETKDELDVKTCVSDGIWVYAGPDKGYLDFLATYIVINHVAPVNQEGKAKFTNENTIAITNEAINKKVDRIELKTVGGLTGGNVNLIGDAYDEYSAGIPVSSGMRKVDVAVFEINVDSADVGQNPYFTMELTLADEKDKDKVMFWHYNMTNEAWDKESLTKAIETENEKVITYKVETESFSPFAITIETKNSSGSSHQGGSRILPATDAPTVTPTQQPTTDATPAVPTVKPTQQQTQKSPAPFVGIVLGLGAAAVLLRLRR